MNLKQVLCREVIASRGRITLRKFRWSDLNPVHSWCRDPSVSRFMTWSAHRSLADTEAFLSSCNDLYAQNSIAPWALVLSDMDLPVGACNFVRQCRVTMAMEIAICLASENRGRGIASEGLTALAEVAFSSEVTQLFADVDVRNLDSIRLLRSRGFSETLSHQTTMPLRTSGEKTIGTLAPNHVRLFADQDRFIPFSFSERFARNP